MSFTSWRSSAFGTGHFSLWAIALGATGAQASQSSISGVRCKRPVAFPRTVGARLAAGMAELDSGNRILLLDEFDQPRRAARQRRRPKFRDRRRCRSRAARPWWIRRPRGRRHRRRIFRHSSDASRSENPSPRNTDASAAPRCGCAARRPGSVSGENSNISVMDIFPGYSSSPSRNGIRAAATRQSRNPRSCPICNRLGTDRMAFSAAAAEPVLTQARFHAIVTGRLKRRLRALR